MKIGDLVRVRKENPHDGRQSLGTHTIRKLRSTMIFAGRVGIIADQRRARQGEIYEVIFTNDNESCWYSDIELEVIHGDRNESW